MNIFLTGAGGLIGSYVKNYTSPEDYVWGFEKSICDILDPALRISIPRYGPEILIHCAAYTNVDGAEKERAKAFDVNHLGTINMVKICEELDIPIVYLSTDAIFDGKNISPYKTTDKADPKSVYGKSKHLGESYAKLWHKHYIVRTNWVYGKGRKNFITQAIDQLEGDNPDIYTIDQAGTPTYAKDLALFIHNLIKTGEYGTYHYTNGGEATRKEVISYIAGLKGKTVNFHKYTQGKAYRGTYTILENSVLAPHWMDSLRGFINETSDSNSLF